MPLSAGDQLGPYEILAPLGAGGMGEVYRAHDSKLNREVAIKVLPAALSSDAQYMARFEREAQMLAALNHPNIATVYGIEQGALVMELVEGADLKGPLPLDEAIAIARQIAAGLEAAHDRGIIHRDLKPANIKITPTGAVKILDFGLAKLSGESSVTSGTSPTMSPTLSLEMTRAGMILGTAAYMSPEQARGKQVDKRTDIWAFGVVLYEVVTGKRLFEGEDLTETLASVVLKEPDLSAAPPQLRRPSYTSWIAAAAMTLIAGILGVGLYRATRAAALRPLMRLDVARNSSRAPPCLFWKMSAVRRQGAGILRLRKTAVLSTCLERETCRLGRFPRWTFRHDTAPRSAVRPLQRAALFARRQAAGVFVRIWPGKRHLG